MEKDKTKSSEQQQDEVDSSEQYDGGDVAESN